MTAAGRPGRRPTASPTTLLRLAGGVLLAAGLIAAARWTPATPAAWQVAERFALAGDECATRLAERESAPFVVPGEAQEPLVVAELARWFRLEAAAVCAANQVSADACADHRFAPGAEVVLPLGRGAAGSPEP